MMRTIEVVALVCVLLAASVQAQQASAGPSTQPTATAPASGPAAERPATDPPTPILLVEKPIHDFGQVWVGDLFHTFTIRNVGREELQINSVKPTCGCTTAGQYPKTIPPGGSGEFPFRLATERYDGPFTTNITVESNDPAHPMTKLTLRVDVKQYVKLSTRVVQFGQIDPDTRKSQTITLTNNTETPIKPRIIEERPSETFKTELSEVEPGQKYELKVSIAPPYQPRYNYYILKIDPGIPNAPPLSITCSAQIPDRLALAPDMLLIVPGRTTGPLQVEFTNNGSAPVKILSATSEDKSLELNVTERAEGKRYTVSVAFPENYAPSEGTEIVLKTDDTAQPELRVPLRRVQMPVAESGQRPQTPAQPATPPTSRPPRPAMELLGKPAPRMSAKSHENQDITIGGASDKVQLVAFYASWCGFCRKAMPQIEKINQQYKGKPFQVVAVNIDARTGPRGKTEQQTLETYKQWNLSMPMVMDPEQNITKPYRMIGTGVPTFFLVGKDGTVEAVHIGAGVVADNTLSNEIDLLLAGKTRADFPGAAPKPATPSPAAGG